MTGQLGLFGGRASGAYTGPAKIISGGQTGADRGGLDAAIDLGIVHGGWCPWRRRAEDGAVPDRYQLTETTSGLYHPRTIANVRGADATVLVVRSARDLTPGTASTLKICKQVGRPWLVVSIAPGKGPIAAQCLAGWLIDKAPHVLNIAGSRESSSPGLQADTRVLLVSALSILRQSA